MRLPKVTSTAIVLLPCIAFIPLTIQIIEGSHAGGTSILKRFMLGAITPSVDPIVLQNAFHGIQVTIATALISWLLSIGIGTFLGVISSNLFWETINGYKFIGIFIRRILAIPRAIHELVWGLFILQILGLSPLVAIIAITIPYSSLIARVISNQIDTLNKRALIAIKQTGTSSLSTLTTYLVPSLSSILTTYGGYRLECAVRSATLLGVFGLGGIGTELQLTLQSLQFRELWSSLWILVGVMIILENTLSFLRNPNSPANKGKNTNIYKIIIITSFVVISLISLQSLEIKFDNFNLYPIQWPNLIDIKSALDQLPIVELIKSTTSLTLLAAGIAIATPPICLMLFPGKLGSISFGILWIFLRLIPAPLIALLLLLCTNPSISVAALAIGLNNIGVLGRLLNENINNQNNLLFNAIKSSGATTQISWLYGKLSPQSKSYLAFAAYRTDVLLRETAVVGVVGGVGLGWQLQESLSSFNWAQVIVITIAFTTLTLIGELISDKIHAYWQRTTTDTSLRISLQT